MCRTCGPKWWALLRSCGRWPRGCARGARGGAMVCSAPTREDPHYAPPKREKERAWQGLCYDGGHKWILLLPVFRTGRGYILYINSQFWLVLQIPQSSVNYKSLKRKWQLNSPYVGVALEQLGLSLKSMFKKRPIHCFLCTTIKSTLGQIWAEIGWNRDSLLVLVYSYNVHWRHIFMILIYWPHSYCIFDTRLSQENHKMEWSCHFGMTLVHTQNIFT